MVCRKERKDEGGMRQKQETCDKNRKHAAKIGNMRQKQETCGFVLVEEELSVRMRAILWQKTGDG